MKYSLATLLLALALPCYAQDEAEPAPGGALPGTINKSEAIGPQPGPDRSLGAQPNPYAGDPQAAAEGRRLFVWYNCAGCHGGRGGGGMGPSLRDAAWRYGFSAQDIFNSIADGRRFGMPAWGTKLPSQQIWKITTYILTMGTDHEPKMPPPNPVMTSPAPSRDLPRRKERKGDN